jgi:tetratricopeptide (TPR) repeat protein
MAEDAHSEQSIPPASGNAGAAFATLGAASREKADRFLEEQTNLARKQAAVADLQIADLKREDRLRHWSIRVRHISDILKLAFELGAAFVILALAGFIGLVFWNAAHDRALVIEAFNVPADMAANGLTGQVVATQLESRLVWMQTHTDTMRAASTFKNNWTDNIKVQIPDTGVSVDEAYRALVGWLGHQTHITGAVWRARGRLTIAVRSGAAAYELAGSEASLQELITKAAERVYRNTQPYRYGVLLMEQGKPEAQAVFRDLALNGPKNERPWAWMGWGLTMTGDLKGQLEKERMASSLEPGLPNFASDLADAEFNLGHDEAGLAAARKTVEQFRQPDSAWQLAADAANILEIMKSVTVAEILGDYRTAGDLDRRLEQMPDYYGSAKTGATLRSLDLAREHDTTASLRRDPGDVSTFAADGGYGLPPSVAYLRAALLERWREALDDLLAVQRLPLLADPNVKSTLPFAYWPWLADAYAHNGMFAFAHVLIDRTPHDCYLCMRMHGDIDAQQKRWGGATYWFARAVKDAPSIPFAYADWGGMLLAKGDVDAAIEKFRAARAKGPHFADPLELWGEALMRKNRSDLAIAKFAEADKYAPNWGRLHLKWGEALIYAGQRDAAARQFAIAAHLDLSAGDKAELARASAGQEIPD